MTNLHDHIKQQQEVNREENQDWRTIGMPDYVMDALIKDTIEQTMAWVEEEVLSPLYEELHSWYEEKHDIVGQGALIELFEKALTQLEDSKK